MIIENILFDEINKLSNINNIIFLLSNSKISKLFIGLKYHFDVQNYFNLIIGEILENYENSGINTIPLIFKIKELCEYIILKEEMINNELNSEKQFKREEAKKKKNDEIYTLKNIYKSKILGDESTSSSISGLFNLDEEEDDFNNEISNIEIFMAKYSAELDKNELIEIINKYPDNKYNEYVQNYLKKQLNLLSHNEKLFSNCVFFDHIQVLRDSKKILYYYQRNFNIVKDIILKAYKKFEMNSHLIPYSIKCISRILYNLLKLKFPDSTNTERIKYIKIFFFTIIIEQFFISLDYGTLLTTDIISLQTRKNIKTIFDIWKHFIIGNFYKSDNEEQSDYTPFNWFFIEIVEESLRVCEKLIDVNMPKYLLRENMNENNNIKNFTIKESNKNFYAYSACFTIDDLLTILNIINCNKIDFFENKEKDPLLYEFKKYYNKVNENENILKRLKEKDNLNTLTYYIYYEVFYSNNISQIIYGNKKDDYFQLEYIKNRKENENNDDINEIIKIKNYLCKLIFISDLTIPLNTTCINLNNLRELLEILDKYNEMKNYPYERIDNSINYINPIISHNYKEIESELNINSFISILDNKKEYSKNNYELLFNSLNNDICESIDKYNYELISPIYENLNNIKENIKILLINEEKFKTICINSKIRKFIDNEQIEVELKFKNNSSEKFFSISKPEINNLKYFNIFLLDKKEKSIICHTIPEFIRKFPNFSKINLNNDVNSSNINNEINIRENLLDYFQIVREHLISKFSEEEIRKAYSKIKKKILAELYNKIFPKDPDTDDLTFHYQCLSLSWVNPSHLNQSEILNDSFTKITTKLFNQMNNEKSYSGKLGIIEKIFKTIYDILKIEKGENYSTDDIAPICEYALIKARPERLSSNLKFIQILMPEKSSSLRKMYFDFLKNYMYAIINCNYNHFNGITEKEYNEKCQEAKDKIIEINS